MTGQISVLPHASENYRHKITNTVQILADWYEPFGGLAGKEVLEFGCGEGTMALGIALQHAPARVVGVEVLDVYEQCLPLAQKNLGLGSLPGFFHLEKIRPGQDISHLGIFDFIYSWSVFEHVDQPLIQTALSSVARALKPRGVFFLQISPLFHSAFGSHLQPWVPEPWAHLAMQNAEFADRFFAAPDAPPAVQDSWSVYMQHAAPGEERNVIWNTYQTLNKTTARQLERLAGATGLKIVRDYRTTNDQPVPDYLAEIYDRDVLTTEQIVWLLQKA